MDPVSAIVGAIAAGAIAAATDVASQAVKDAYGALKELLAKRFRRKAAVEALEEAPDSASARDALGGALRETGADRDGDVMRLAEALAAALSELPVESLGAASIEIGQVQGYRNAIVRELSAAGNVTVSGVTAQSGDAIVEHVRAGADPKKKAF